MSIKYNEHCNHEGRGLGEATVTVAVEVEGFDEAGKPTKFTTDDIVARAYASDDGKSPLIDFIGPVKVNQAKEIADLVQAKWKPEVSPVAMAVNETDRLKAKLRAAGIDPDKS